MKERDISVRVNQGSTTAMNDTFATELDLE
jgi:hypothetical protein